jgi:hypothetical protein
MNKITNARTLQDILDSIVGYHDYPECGGNASIELPTGPWFLSTSEDAQCWWDGAPTYGELLSWGIAHLIVAPNHELGDDETVEEDYVIPAIIDRAHEVCAMEEEQYTATALEYRIDHICSQINWDDEVVVRHYPRDFSNEFDLNVVEKPDIEPGSDVLDEHQLRITLERWLPDPHWCGGGDVLELDTYDPY